MQISHYPSLTQPDSISSIRQIGTTGTQSQVGQRLVFVYPFMYDSSIEKSTITLLRDFFVVDVIGQIKTTNILNITNRAIAMPDPQSLVNPAQEVRQSLWAATPNVPVMTFTQPTISTYDYQQQIGRYNSFIVNQLQHDPKYTDLRPQTSSLLVENLLTVPLIIGTKEYSTKINTLYWVLVTALMLNVKLDSPTNMDRLRTVMNSIPPTNYMNFLLNDKSRDILNGIIPVPKTSGPGYYKALPGKLAARGAQATGRLAVNVGRNIGASAKELEDRIIQGNGGNSRADQLARLATRGIIGAAKFPVKAPIAIAKATGRAAGALIADTVRLRNNELSVNTDYVSRLTGYVQDGFSAAINNLKAVTNEAQWTIETGAIETRAGITLNSGPVITDRTMRRVYDQAISSFQSYLANILPRLFFSMEQILGPLPIGISVQDKYNRANEELANCTNDFFNRTANIVTTFLKGDNTAKKLDDASSICKANVDIGNSVRKYFDNLSGHSYSQLKVNFGKDNLQDFFRNISSAANGLDTYSTTYESWSNTLTDSPAHMQASLSDYKNCITKVLTNAIYEDYPVGSGNLPMFDNYPTIPGPETLIVRGGPNPNFTLHEYSNIAGLIPGLRMADLRQMVRELTESIINIVYFTGLYNFFSYTCIYLRDVDFDVKVQMKDALEFPNYVFVLPIELVKALYVLHKTNIFRNVLTSGIAPFDLPDVDDTKIGELNFKAIINVVKDKLGVPNFMVVDGDTVYYKFMYMSQVNNMKLSSINSYVNHQKEVLPGF